MLRRNIRTPSLRQRRRQVLFDRFFILLALIGAVVLLVSQLSQLPALAITDVAVRGNDRVSDKKLRELVQKKLSGNYLHLFSRSNIFLYSRRAITRSVLATFPRIASVDVDTESLTRISLTVVEREPVALYCASRYTQVGTSTISEACFSIDNDGFIFAPTVTSSLRENTVYRKDGDPRPAGALRRFVLPENDFHSIRQFIEDVAPLNIGVVSVQIISETQYEIETERVGTIIIDPTDGYDVIQNNLELVLESNDLSETVDSGVAIDYIDLRFGNKIFYKLNSGAAD